MAGLFAGRPLAELRVGDAMACDVAVLRMRQTLREAELLMRIRAVRRLPVVDDGLCVVGMLSCHDLFRWVDDGGSIGQTGEALHLVRTLAAIGRTRQPRDAGAIGSARRRGP